MSIALKMTRLEPITRLSNLLISKQALYDRVGIRVIRWIGQNFEQGGIERRWAPLRASTIFARRRGSSKPLQNTGRLQQEVTHKATGQSVVVGWPTGSVARFHHFGTGPYEIRPRNKKALRFFAPPLSGLGSGQARTVLQRRAGGTPRVGLVPAQAARAGGLGIPKGRGDLQSVVFARGVHHPGLPARPLLPSVGLATQLAQEVIEDALKEGISGSR